MNSNFHPAPETFDAEELDRLSKGNATQAENSRQAEIDGALKRARQLLVAPPNLAVDYPIDALGPLANVCTKMATNLQVREAMAGQSLLSIASLITQSRCNVRTLESIKPVSLNVVTVAESGDGKTTADNVAKQPVEDRQRTDSRNYLSELAEIENAPKSSVKRDAPVPPYRIMMDGTVEGIRSSFQCGVASQGVFSSEAAVLLCGYGMNKDNRAKSAGTFNGLWDNREISVGRATAGRIQLYDRRLSNHWMIQPDAAREALHDPLLSTMGFWPRFLIAWPEPSRPRVAKPFIPDECMEIDSYWRNCRRLLIDLPPNCSNLPTMESTDKAIALAGTFFERMEQAAKGTRASLAEIKPFAVRSTEQAFRIAGVLAAFDGKDRIDDDMMRNGITLATYSLETWRGIFCARDRAATQAKALKLAEWLAKQPNARVAESAILHIGPVALRSRAARDAALSMLEHKGVVRRYGHHWEITA